MLNKTHLQNKSYSKSPQFRNNQSTSKSPDLPKMGDYKKNQLIQHLNKMKNKNNNNQMPQKTLDLSPLQQMEQEVVEFKKEIEKKFLLSAHNIQFKFPSEGEFSDDESLNHLLDVTVYNLKEQNNAQQRNLVHKTFDQDKKFEQDIYSKMQNLIQKTQIKDIKDLKDLKDIKDTKEVKDDCNTLLRIRTEGDEADIRILNNLKTTKKLNYYKPQTKTLYDTIKQKKDKQLAPIINNLLIQSPKYKKHKSPIDLTLRQKTVFVGNVSKSPQIVARSKIKIIINKVPQDIQRTGIKSNQRLHSSKSISSQASKNQEIENTLTTRLKDKQKPIKQDLNGRGMHNYYFSMQNNNNSSSLFIKQYQTNNPRTQNNTQNITNQAKVQESQISQAKHLKQIASNNTTMYQNQSYRTLQQQNTTAWNKNYRTNRTNQSNDSNHSDQSYKQKLAFQQDKLKELLKKSKPFYN